MVRYSFGVRLFHPFLPAGLSRRTQRGRQQFEAVLKTFTAEAVRGDLLGQWSDFVGQAQIEILPIDKMDLGPVVEAFFDSRPPFGPKKRNEWRDAIVLEGLRVHAAKIKCPIFVCSADKDFETSCNGQVLIHRAGIADALALASINESIADEVIAYLQTNEKRAVELLQDEPSVDDATVLGIEGVKYEAIDIYDTAVEVAGRGHWRFQAHASVPDYGCSPVDRGSYAMLYKNTVRVDATRELEFTARVTFDVATRKPTAIEELVVSGPPRMSLSQEDDEVEMVEAWHENHDQ